MRKIVVEVLAMIGASVIAGAVVGGIAVALDAWRDRREDRDFARRVGRTFRQIVRRGRRRNAE